MSAEVTESQQKAKISATWIMLLIVLKKREKCLFPVVDIMVQNISDYILLKNKNLFSVKKLIMVCTKLLMFNDGCKESQGESVKVSQNRAALFDVTLLMLVYMDQISAFWVLYYLVLKDTITILVYSPAGREAQWLSQESWSPCVGGVGGGPEPGGLLGVSVYAGGGEDSARWWSGVTVCSLHIEWYAAAAECGALGGNKFNSSTASCAASLLSMLRGG